MIHRLAYVTCDRCRVPAQPASCNDVAEARGIARSEGYRRVKDPNTGRTIDVCAACAAHTQPTT